MIRTRDSGTAGSHLKEQIVAYPRKPRGKVKRGKVEIIIHIGSEAQELSALIIAVASSTHYMKLSECLLSASLSSPEK